MTRALETLSKLTSRWRSNTGGLRTITLVAMALLAIVLSWPNSARAQQTGATAEGASAQAFATIDGVSIRDRGAGETEILIIGSKPMKGTAFELLSPPRMVVDLPNVKFALPRTPASPAGQLVMRYRYGSMGPGRGRIVFDTSERAIVVGQRTRRVGDRYALNLTLRPRVSGRGNATSSSGLNLRPSRFSPRERRARARARKPVVVIDPGHGGADPGAVTSSGIYEKTIALSVGRRLASRLRAAGKYKVLLTRTSDTFVSLDDRVRMSEDAEADLFISLHADAVGDQRLANSVRGATVYTVSDQASDEVARALAEKENAADSRSGTGLGPTAQSQAVRSILVDLMRRESTDHAARFREHLISRLGKTIALSRSPRRAAAFKVLKQVQTPAVLIELGYMSNTTDQKLMQTKSWQVRVASAIAGAVKLQFAAR